MPIALTPRAIWIVGAGVGEAAARRAGPPGAAVAAVDTPVDVAAVDPMPKAGGKWNTFEVTARGPVMTVMMNGAKTSEGKDERFGSGPIALQYGSGVVKFRKVAVKPL